MSISELLVVIFPAVFLGDEFNVKLINEKTFLKSSGSIRRATEDGLKIASKQAPPALIQIPIYKDK